MAPPTGPGDQYNMATNALPSHGCALTLGTLDLRFDQPDFCRVRRAQPRPAIIIDSGNTPRRQRDIAARRWQSAYRPRNHAR